MAVISASRDTNNNVSLVRIEISDLVADFASVNYVANHQEEINILNGGEWSWFSTDMILVAASNGDAFFYFLDPTFATATIYGEQGSGTVNPALANSVAYYAAGGSSISGMTPAANGVLVTSSGSVPSISSVLPGAVQGNITAVGTISSGTWQGSTVTVPYGGTGNTTFSAYSVLCAGTTATGAFQNVSGTGSVGDLLISNGPGALPTWQSGIASGTINTGAVNDLAYYSINPTGKTLSAIPTATNSVLVTSGIGVPSVSSTLPSGLTIPSPKMSIINDTNGNEVLLLTPVASAVNFIKITNQAIGQAPNIQANGADTDIQLDIQSKGVGEITLSSAALTNQFSFYSGTAYTHQSVFNFPVSASTTRVYVWPDAAGTVALTSNIPSLPLSPANGGTGVASPTAHGVMVAEGASAMTPIVLSSGQILIGSTGIDPVAAAMNSGTGILVANGAGSITVNLAAIADHTVLANISGGALAPSSTTLTALIDNAIGSTQGNILYRNSTVWTVLAPGTAGQLLATGGAAANPAWSTATFPTTGGAAGNILISNGTNYIASTSLWPNTVGSANSVLYSNGTSNAYSTLTALIDAAIGSTQGNILYRNSTVWTVLAPGTAGQLLRTGGAAANPAWSTATFPATGGAAGNILISDGTNYIASTSLWPNTVGSTGKILRSNGTSNAYTTATYPDVGTSTGSFLYADGTNWIASTSLWPNTVGSAGKIVRSNGTSNAYTTATYPDTATGTGTILRADGTNWVATTATYPTTTSVNQVLYSSADNVIGGIAASASTILAYNSSAVPSATSPTTVAALFTLPTQQIFTSGSGTYTTPANCRQIHVRAVAGGGGGAGSGTSGNTSGTSGGNTTFSTITCVGGTGAAAGNTSTPPAGGTASGGTINLSGGSGAGYDGGVVASPGGSGGNTPFGGGGGGAGSNAAGGNGATNTGGGGGGAGGGAATGQAGGGAGGYSELYINSPAGTYSYGVGAAGAAGGAGAAGFAGGAGGSGIIIVEEFYI